MRSVAVSAPARWLARRVTIDFSAGRIRRPPVDPRRVECRGVDVGRVAAAMTDPNRMVGRRGVEIGAAQRSSFLRLRVVALEAEDPLPFRRFRGPLANRRLDVGNRSQIAVDFLRCSRPALAGCECASMKPGTTVRPLRSTRVVRGPASASMSLEVPTAMMRSPAMAIASATGAAVFIVRRRPPCRTSCGASRCGWTAARQPRRPAIAGTCGVNKCARLHSIDQPGTKYAYFRRARNRPPGACFWRLAHADRSKDAGGVPVALADYTICRRPAADPRRRSRHARSGGAVAAAARKRIARRSAASSRGRKSKTSPRGWAST